MSEDRALVLLRAAYCLMRQCEESDYVESLFDLTAHYDDTECDGYCLARDIGLFLGLEE